MKQPAISGGHLIEWLSDVSDAHRPRGDRRSRLCIWHCICGFRAHSDTEMGPTCSALSGTPTPGSDGGSVIPRPWALTGPSVALGFALRAEVATGPARDPEGPPVG